MRWDDLFTDLEAQADALEVAERAGEVAERTRMELAGIGLRDRLRAAVGTRLRVRLLGGTTVEAALTRVGPDWLLLAGGGRESVVALSALAEVGGLGRASAPDSGGVVAGRLGLRSALRGIARDRSPVRIDLVTGAAIDATLDRVGADFVEAATHAAGEARRRGEVREVLLVPFAAVAAVSRWAG